MHRLLSFTYLYLIPLLLSAVSSLRAFRWKWPKHLQAFSFFLILTVIVEAFALTWKWGKYWLLDENYKSNNHWIYGAFITVRHLFMLYFFYHILESSKHRKIIRVSVIPVLIFNIINYIFIQSPFEANSYSLIITNLITIFLCLIFFIQVLKNERIIPLSQSAEVWIALGTFLYYAATLPLFIFFNYLQQIKSPIFNSYLYINDAMNVAMYSLYLIAFLCKPHSLK